MVTRRGVGRAGFTLIEILVAVILLSLLVAATFPVVMQQIERGEPTRVANDLASIRSGVEAFRANVRSAWPGDLEDLVNQVLTDSTDVELTGKKFTTNQRNRWDGPYIDAALVHQAHPAGNVGTGFNATISAAIGCFDATAATVTNTTFDASPSTCTAGTHHVAVEITGIDSADYVRLNSVIDPTDGYSGSGDDVAGRLRRDADTSVSYYLITPFRT